MQHEQLKDFQNSISTNNKSFGIQLSAVFFIVFLIRLYLKFFGVTELILILLSIFFIIISYLKPSFLNLIQVLFSKLAKLLAKIINPIVMFFFYLLIFVPFGFILKIFRYDPLKEKINKNLNSYWNHSNEFNKKYFTKQF
jgi:glucan phosphoethanolaminetransferase (alkaline phosphatase superfamily)